MIVHGGWWLIFIGEKYEHHQTPEKEEKGWNKGKDYKRKYSHAMLAKDIKNCNNTLGDPCYLNNELYYRLDH